MPDSSSPNIKLRKKRFKENVKTKRNYNLTKRKATKKSAEAKPKTKPKTKKKEVSKAKPQIKKAAPKKQKDQSRIKPESRKKFTDRIKPEKKTSGGGRGGAASKPATRRKPKINVGGLGRYNRARASR